MLLAAVGSVVTLVNLVAVGVVLFFLPAVAVNAAILQVAPVAVRLGLLLRTPEAALFSRRVFVDMGLAAEVLPVVRVLTLIALVAPHFVVERAPDCLKVEHVEVAVLL